MGHGAAFRLPAGAELGAADSLQEDVAVRGQAADRSQHGRRLFRARPATRAELLARADRVAPRCRRPTPTNRTVTFSHTLDEDMQALALSPDQVPPNIMLQVEAVRPDGSRAPMIRLNTRPDWERRYWFERPLTLPRGTRVEVTANLEDPDMLSAAFSAAAPPRISRAGRKRAPRAERRAGTQQTHGAISIGDW